MKTVTQLLLFLLLVLFITMFIFNVIRFNKLDNNIKELSKFYLKYKCSKTHEEDGMVVDEENTIYYLISDNVELDSQISTNDFSFSGGKVMYMGTSKLFHLKFNLEPYGSIEVRQNPVKSPQILNCSDFINHVY